MFPLITLVPVVAVLVGAIWWVDRREKQMERDDLDLHAGWDDPPAD